jgi:hypothetical protein
MLMFRLETSKFYSAIVHLSDSQLPANTMDMASVFTNLGFSNAVVTGNGNVYTVTGTWNAANTVASWPDMQYHVVEWKHV